MITQAGVRMYGGVKFLAIGGESVIERKEDIGEVAELDDQEWYDCEAGGEGRHRRCNFSGNVPEVHCMQVQGEQH